jgi:1,4-dihydroxy-2-naphthoate octaprenyltransferase
MITDREREREREREPFLLVALNFAKQESIRLIISTVVVVSVLSAYGEKMILFVLCLLLFFSFLFFLYNTSTYLFSRAPLGECFFFFFFFFLFFQASIQHHESSNFWITESSKAFGQY